VQLDCPAVLCRTLMPTCLRSSASTMVGVEVAVIGCSRRTIPGTVVQQLPEGRCAYLLPLSRAHAPGIPPARTFGDSTLTTTATYKIQLRRDTVVCTYGMCVIGEKYTWMWMRMCLCTHTVVCTYGIRAIGDVYMDVDAYVFMYATSKSDNRISYPRVSKLPYMRS
jgi:hypothetical protein